MRKRSADKPKRIRLTKHERDLYAVMMQGTSGSEQMDAALELSQRLASRPKKRKRS